MTFQLRNSASLITVILFFCPCAFSQDAAQLFRTMQEALGGADRLAAIHDFEQTVRAKTWTNDVRPIGEVRKRTRWIRPNHLRLDQVGPADTYVLYFNGASGWEILPDKTVADLAGGELKFADHYLWSFLLNLWLANRNGQCVMALMTPDVIAVSDKADASKRIEIELDTKTSLPAKMRSVSLADPSHPVPSETQLENWKSLGGVEFPQRISIFQNGRRVALITVEETKLNQGLSPGELSLKPPDLKPVMSQEAR